MREFIYVMCYVVGDEYPAFEHSKLYADDEDGAYTLGGKWADQRLILLKGKLINDYVIEVSQ